MAIRIVTAALAALALAACSKSEEVNKKPAPAPRIEAAQPQAPAPSGEIDPALKERLARQEAASRMFEKNVLEPPAPKAPAKPPETPKASEPPKAPAEPPKAAAAAPQKAAPAPAAPPPAPVAAPPPTPPPPAPVPAPAQAEPPPRTDVAAAKPSAAAPSRETRLMNRVDPEFPREAIQAGVERGSVKVRIWLEESGAVSRVEVVDANPRRVFDRAVVRALSQWKFNEGAGGRSVETEVEFKR